MSQWVDSPIVLEYFVDEVKSTTKQKLYGIDKLDLFWEVIRKYSKLKSNPMQNPTQVVMILSHLIELKTNFHRK